MKRIVLYMIASIIVVMAAMAQPKFRTTELERLATALNLDASSLPEGYGYPKVNSFILTTHVSENVVDHIGLRLFADELRTQGKSPIFDFLERYFLQLKYPPVVKTASNMIRDDEFRFITGSMATIDLIRTSDDFAFANDNRRYTATWSRNGKVFLSVSFPVEYELISGENKIEAEDNLPSDIIKAKITPTKDRQRVDNYINNCFSNRLYFQQGKLIVSEQHPAETAANMMLSTNIKGNYSINITQVSYGFKKKVFQVPLRQWISFCQNNGCQLYFGIEQILDNGDIRAVVIAVNQAENYNHVLSVTIPSSIIAHHQGKIEGHLYPYVPTHNVMNMFANYRKSNPKNVVKR